MILKEVNRKVYKYAFFIMVPNLSFKKVNKVMPIRVDPEFKHKLLEVPGGETFKLCYQCGTCTATCPVARIIEVFRPNKIIQLAKLGIRNVLFSEAAWLCSACNSCTERCPQGIKIHDVMHALKDLAVKEGYTPDFSLILREEIPLPVIYCWICISPSKEEPKQSEFNDLILKTLKHSLAVYKKEVTPIPKTRKEKIAIIGSGPAGLTAAWELNRMGYPVTIFESYSKPGGMLRVGIPEYRLPKEILDVEIQHIKDLGVEIRTNTTIDIDLFNDLLKGEEYKAIFIATGSHKGMKLNVEGEDLEGVVPALDLLRQVNLQKQAYIGKRVLVIGGGNVAMDAAGTALRLGAEEVQLACLESREEMPAHEWKIQEALMEEVVLNVSWGSKRIIGDGKKVTGVELIRCVSVFDEKGRFNPSFDETVTKVLEVDTIILAIGQMPNLSFLGKDIHVFRNTIAVDSISLETNLPGVFAGGDAVSGAASVIEAINAGKIVATSIDSYLRNQVIQEKTRD